MGVLALSSGVAVSAVSVGSYEEALLFAALAALAVEVIVWP